MTDREVLRRALRFYRYCFGGHPIWPYRHGMKPYMVRAIRANAYRLQYPEEESADLSLLHSPLTQAGHEQIRRDV